MSQDAKGRFSHLGPDPRRLTFWNKHKDMVRELLREVNDQVFNGAWRLSEDLTPHHDLKSVKNPSWSLKDPIVFGNQIWVCSYFNQERHDFDLRIVAVQFRGRFFYQEVKDISFPTESNLASSLEEAIRYVR